MTPIAGSPLRCARSLNLVTPIAGSSIRRILMKSAGRDIVTPIARFAWFADPLGCPGLSAELSWVVLGCPGLSAAGLSWVVRWVVPLGCPGLSWVVLGCPGMSRCAPLPMGRSTAADPSFSASPNPILILS